MTEEEKREVERRAYFIHEHNLQRGFVSKPEMDWEEALSDFIHAKQYPWERPLENIGAML